MKQHDIILSHDIDIEMIRFVNKLYIKMLKKKEMIDDSKVETLTKMLDSPDEENVKLADTITDQFAIR
jgi:hypothetical protein